MASVLMIVARDRPDRAVAVVLDRRFGERRREVVEAATAEQRQRDRRRRDVDDGLQRLGWATARTA
jgi:hypothetical protein